jgi:hypothetical protein
MKRILTAISSAIIICLIPFSMVAGQEKKEEQKIRIVVDDGSGTKVVIDTLITGGIKTDSLILKDGNVIYLNNLSGETVNCDKNGPENMTVTVSSDGKGTKKVVKEVTVISSDSVKNPESAENNIMYVYSDSKAHKGKSEEKYRVITSASGEEGKGEKHIYIRKGKEPDKEMEKTFNVYVSNDDKDTTVEMTKYVIAKDGLVVTVEGKDEAKAKDLVNEIRSKMGIKNEGTDKVETVKVKTK